jgi:hypothetical protein
LRFLKEKRKISKIILKDNKIRRILSKKIENLLSPLGDPSNALTGIAREGDATRRVDSTLRVALVTRSVTSRLVNKPTREGAREGRESLVRK